MKISVNINGVLRNVLLKFQQVYEKYEDRDVKSDVITPNLMEYTHFDDEEKLYNFLYQEAPMEIFGQAKETFISVVALVSAFVGGDYLDTIETQHTHVITEECTVVRSIEKEM